jgi:hypothetical protein
MGTDEREHGAFSRREPRTMTLIRISPALAFAAVLVASPAMAFRGVPSIESRNPAEAPPPPAGLEVRCLTLNGSTGPCPVVVYGDFTVWPYIFTRFPGASALVTYDSNNNVVMTVTVNLSIILYARQTWDYQTIQFWGRHVGGGDLDSVAVNYEQLFPAPPPDR